MLKKVTLTFLMVILIVGCTSEDKPEVSDLPPADSTAESAVNPVDEPEDNPVADEDAAPNVSESESDQVINPDVTTVAPSDSVDLGEITPAPDTGEESELIVQPAPGIPDPEARMVQLASAKLADRLGIDISEITLVEADPMEWPDTGLDCPSPDLLYAAVLTPGYQITLEADGQTYIYHTDTDSAVVLCVDGQPA